MYKKGAVVLVPFPFTDLSNNKVRPAVIVSRGKIGRDVIVVFITSQTKTKGDHLVTVKPTEENGLKIASKIVCAKLATLDTKIILGEIGTLEPTTLRSVDTELKSALAL